MLSAIAIPWHDAIYDEAWQSVIAQCQTRLDRVHLLQALEVKTADDFRRLLANLQTDHVHSQQVVTLLRNLLPTLGHYEAFAETFVKLMKHNVETSMMWGLPSLVIRFSLGFDRVRDHIGDLLRKIGHKLEYLNEYGRDNSDNHMKDVSAQVHTDLVELWLNVIAVFKDKPEGGSMQPEEVISQFRDFMGKLDNAVERIKDIVNLAVARRFKERGDFYSRVESMSVGCGPDIQSTQLPYYQLPAASNPRFFGRDSELSEMETRLALPSPGGFASLALYGLGGVGKSQVALHYALGHVDDYDVIIWIHAADNSLEMSFSKAAVNLGVPGAKPNDHPQNRLRLLLWLQRTGLRWMLIFDNVESPKTLQEFWPTAKKGAILLTSRKHVFAMQPANGGIEIRPFSIELSIDFLLRSLTSTTGASDAERNATKVLSQDLGGHPLALAQASALGYRRRLNAQKLLDTYCRFPRKVRETVDPDLLHAGYTLPMSRVFLVSFRELSREAITILSIMAFVEPNEIPEDLFIISEDAEVPHELQFLQDEFGVSKHLNELLDLSLVGRHSGGDKLFVHRLVQIECQHYAEGGSRQALFDLAAKVLCLAFPQQQDERYGHRLPLCSKYIRHVFCLRDNLRGDWHPASVSHPNRGDGTLRPSDDFCLLLRNTSWYCVEVHRTRELEATVTTAMDAARATGFDVREPRHYAQLCNCASRLWAQRGNFDRAKALMLESKDIRERIGADVWGAVNNLGNIYFSQGNFLLALATHEQCTQLFAGGEAGMAAHARRTNRLNKGRTLTVLGRFAEAAAFIDGAERDNGDDWLMAIHISYHRSLLLRARGELDEATRGFSNAIALIKGGMLYQSLLDAACNYKIGCILMQQSKPQKATIYLQTSHYMHDLRGSPPCELARVKYMLSRAMLASLGSVSATGEPVDPTKDAAMDTIETATTTRATAARLHREAQAIRAELMGQSLPLVHGGGAADTGASEEALFDNLVEGQLR